jgi:copper(I)-binding protein
MRRFLQSTALLGLLVLSAASAVAHEFKLGDLEIDHPYSKAMIPGAQVAGGFMTITNHGTAEDRLIAVESAIAGMIQIHEMKVENDVMTMKEVAGGIVIPPGGSVVLAPGGLHVMFMKVATPTKDGNMIKATLVFEKAGKVDVEFAVGPANMKKDDHSQHHKHGG